MRSGGPIRERKTNPNDYSSGIEEIRSLGNDAKTVCHKYLFALSQVHFFLCILRDFPHSIFLWQNDDFLGKTVCNNNNDGGPTPFPTITIMAHSSCLQSLREELGLIIFSPLPPPQYYLPAMVLLWPATIQPNLPPCPLSLSDMTNYLLASSAKALLPFHVFSIVRKLFGCTYYSFLILTWI